VLVEVRPALAMERLFETVVALAQEGRCLRSGMPKPLDLAMFVREFRSEVRAPFPPPLAVRAAPAPLAWMAERRGRTLQPAYAYVAPAKRVGADPPRNLLGISWVPRRSSGR
jgi:hypothetical protein